MGGSHTSVWASLELDDGVEKEQRACLAEHAVADVLDPAAVSYRQLLRSAPPWPPATRFSPRWWPRGRLDPGQAGDPAAAATALAEELRQLARRLEGAGLTVSPPLSVGGCAGALRVRLDPMRRLSRLGGC